MLSFNTRDLDFSQNYKFLIGSILPRPIAVVSTVNENGTFNLAPFSFFTAISAKPMIIAFSPMIRTSTGQRKDTYKNILRTKEFVINMCPEELIDQVNLCSTELPYGEDEFLYSGLTPLASHLIQAPRLKESPIHFECILKDILDYGEEAGGGSLITGEVIQVHLAEKIYQEGRLVTQNWQPIGRGAGNDWIRTNEIIIRERLMKSQIQK
jgi:flavin reductase (DIM6/NTAB) family NADH-FMN oxidoreductase RutF